MGTAPVLQSRKLASEKQFFYRAKGFFFPVREFGSDEALRRRATNILPRGASRAQ
jgi:hypothetical protein